MSRLSLCIRTLALGGALAAAGCGKPSTEEKRPSPANPAPAPVSSMARPMQRTPAAMRRPPARETTPAPRVAAAPAPRQRATYKKGKACPQGRTILRILGGKESEVGCGILVGRGQAALTTTLEPVSGEGKRAKITVHDAFGGTSELPEAQASSWERGTIDIIKVLDSPRYLFVHFDRFMKGYSCGMVNLESGKYASFFDGPGADHCGHRTPAKNDALAYLPERQEVWCMDLTSMTARKVGSLPDAPDDGVGGKAPWSEIDWAEKLPGQVEVTYDDAKTGARATKRFPCRATSEKQAPQKP